MVFWLVGFLVCHPKSPWILEIAYMQLTSSLVSPSGGPTIRAEELPGFRKPLEAAPLRHVSTGTFRRYCKTCRCMYVRVVTEQTIVSKLPLWKQGEVDLKNGYKIKGVRGSNYCKEITHRSGTFFFEQLYYFLNTTMGVCCAPLPAGLLKSLSFTSSELTPWLDARMGIVPF